MQRRPGFPDSWPNWASIFFLLAAGVACDEKKSLAPEQTLEQRELLDPEEPAREFAERCRPIPNSKPVTLRAVSSKDSPGSLEAGSAVSIPGGFIVGVLRTEVDTFAELAFFDGRGASKVTRLSRVHGSVEAPRAVSFGSDAIVVVPDNDAGHTRLRLAKVRSPARDSEVSWGPEIQVRRGESQSFSVAIRPADGEKQPARAIVVWDDFDKASLRSQVRALVFDPVTMKPVGSEQAMTPPEEDATEPMVFDNPGGSPSFWIVWLTYQSDTKIQPSGGLVDEPPRVLRALKLDSRGEPEGTPITVSEAEANVLVFDANLLEGGALSIAYRQAEGGRSEGASPVQIRIVDAGGGIGSQTVSHEELGLGAPALIDFGNPRKVWLSARATESDVLLGRLGKGPTVEDFALEAGLSERIPLAGSQNGLLVMEPDGLDLRFSTVECRAPSTTRN